MAHRPVGAGSSFTFTAGTATTSSTFTVQSNVLRVVAVGGAAFVAVGATPSATAADYYVPSGETATLALTKASNRVVGVTTGTTTIVTVPEGTQVPFGVGDYVTLSVSGQTYYNFTHQRVISVDTSSNVGGYYQTRMTVDYNSAGIVTAFASEASVSASNKVSVFGAGSGTLYYQQVQVSGQA
ncbi:MAG: hypothetical protein EBU90_02810 [Proteobacteria bacterium]|jgi:hypothetical protein|nr:hypothetical protein [Pseudomonadota bacterium]